MNRYNDLPAYLINGSSLGLKTEEKTAKVIASEVAVGVRSYYGVFRSFTEEGLKYNIEGEDVSTDGTSWWHNNTNTFNTSEFNTPELPLELFISSFGDALSYTSFETVGTSDYQYETNNTTTTNNNQFDNLTQGYGRSNLNNFNDTPMGSTTKLITSDTSSSFQIRCCNIKCLPILGTLFTTISLTASLGNVIRLPSAVFLYGGGSFLIAYICIALFLGIPLIFLEVTLGQFCQQGTTKLWRAVPLFKGVGVVKILTCALTSVYYAILLIISLLHAIWSLLHPMPYSQCITQFLPRYTPSLDNDSVQPCFRNDNSDDLLSLPDTWVAIEILLMLTLWIVVIFCVFRNSVSFRVSCCILVPITLFGLLTIFAEAVQRNTKGLEYLTIFKWNSLLSIDLWYFALVQFFFSTQVGFGNITTCAGRLYPKNSPFWTSVLYILMNITIGIGIVCVIYMWTGDVIISENVVHVPERREMFVFTLIYDVISQCYGLYSQLWAVVCFSVIAITALISMISLVYTIVVAITVETKSKLSWTLVTTTVCAIGFILSSCALLEYDAIIRLFDYYVIGRLVIMSTLLEVFGFVYVYGLKSLSNDFEFVLGYKLNVIWKFVWYIAPFILLVAEIWSWFGLTSHEDKIWLYLTQWMIYIFTWMLVIGIGLWQIFSQVDYNISQKFVSSLKPSRNWGPVDPIYRHCWVQWRKQYQTTGERDFTLRRRGTRDYTHSVKRGKHAGPVGMRYSVNPPSNQSTLQYKMDKNNEGNITANSTWDRSEISTITTNNSLRYFQ